MKRTILILVVFSLVWCPVAFAGSFQKLVGKGMEAGSHALTARSGYCNASKGEDNALTEAAKEAAVPTAVVVYSVGSAAASGAGTLTGYAGMASAVSNLGLSCATTAIAGTMGSSATGAAATAVVTSAVGGPVVMGVIVVGSAVAVSYGAYKAGEAVWEWFGD